MNPNGLVSERMFTSYTPSISTIVEHPLRRSSFTLYTSISTWELLARHRSKQTASICAIMPILRVLSMASGDGGGCVAAPLTRDEADIGRRGEWIENGIRRREGLASHGHLAFIISHNHRCLKIEKEVRDSIAEEGDVSIEVTTVDCPDIWSPIIPNRETSDPS